MGIISIEKADHLYWLGRYAERVYTTLRVFFHIYDHMIVYTSNKQFAQAYLFDEDNPDSVVSNMKRAYDNAVVLREELSSNVLSYVQLALDTFQACKKTTAPLLELQQAIDYLLAFWGCADDYVDQEDCRNILKCGKYVERLDLFIRLDYHREDLEKEYRKLVNRLYKANLDYNKENLKHLEQIIMDKGQQKSYDQEALGCLGGLIS